MKEESIFNPPIVEDESTKLFHLWNKEIFMNLILNIYSTYGIKTKIILFRKKEIIFHF